ncbi:transcriptional regulator, TetR family [Pseudonocardia thermophila]|jgi:Bacterial regulatory proteins, tetR family.|uniref:Transcriptional regulator, TetR family n=1 Tax=Pseudonocardia thermophila TaxID=1848 RepID=A0A1M6YN19_PSETH|nr:helix-turn-helix domain-containing protein [Pseudonocardia thermophila]SHL19607.1 transcriptional regulator, TetR family [Pseudonocardia thermophila]
MAGTASPQDREAIMRAAVRLGSRRGAPAVEDILRAAHVNRRIFYRHFASKDALLAALAAEAAEALGRGLATAVERAVDGAAAARAWADHYLGVPEDEERANAARPFLAPDPTAGEEVLDVVEAAHAQHRTLLEEALRRGRGDVSLPDVDPVPDAVTIHAVVLRHVEPALRGRGDIDLATVRDWVEELILRLGGVAGK